ncbi:hypothetical protein [Flavobacterium gawalongense]|uniref:Protein SirB1 N-terminal domain-containing protein n=1 Tax=Flavobacterium gawalongense TaxID=2594432 RepID=A0A553BMZ9_9FLAO|nr:hypothetical protein [Flavobacterium gawalongense]TRW97018.1 hypothetical protein FNW33_16980 [Flavobacterium gawalongense]TRX01486.1 hypothetical protein FNW12_17035 [Flavobacterium gawalongense]TRX09623.1 hypothetical protein FNW11_08965 [Flavobacterium gawalongense]TRX10893.1 hypothetical protein FNW10_09055 [Flavobacterium gawalongense]TRX28028.1 hypothetical protein FNW38_08435 [Flavobacterium gawalongense]
MMKFLFILIISFYFNQIQAQSKSASYNSAYIVLESMLEGKDSLNFKKALFTVENAWYDNKLDFFTFENDIKKIASSCSLMISKKRFERYKTAKNWAIFMWITQKTPENESKNCEYDFKDFLGESSFSNTFVTRLIKDKKGNCLSLPLLYKCVAQELKAEAYLTLGPSHAWIRHIDEKGEWLNVELTSAQFPSDGIMMTELGIKTQAIKTGAYFKPLSEKETIAVLMTLLANGYENKFGLDDFTDRCADLSIKYYDANVIAIMLKSNRVAKLANNDTMAFENKIVLHKMYLTLQNKLNDIGGESINPDEYTKWVNSMKTRKE